MFALIYVQNRKSIDVFTLQQMTTNDAVHHTIFLLYITLGTNLDHCVTKSYLALHYTRQAVAKPPIVYHLYISLSYTQPTGITYLHDFIYPALMYAVMFYVIRKRLGDCVTFLASGTLEGDTMQRLNALT